MSQINTKKITSYKTNILSTLPHIFNLFQNTDYFALCITLNQYSDIISVTSLQNQNEYKLIGEVVDLCSIKNIKYIVFLLKKPCIDQDISQDTKFAINLGNSLDEIDVSLMDLILTDQSQNFFSLRYHDLLCKHHQDNG
ncbi:hypothetical protein [Candidatus Bandiella numerosa]|uniref:hypothetical protein n=1 Tax=Candidatus Bandiella numerosa TaxID=2570586 RepID=UPI001F2690B5|nr:hypothetical protein [Candidatus Bandiella numerosa]